MRYVPTCWFTLSCAACMLLLCAGALLLDRLWTAQSAMAQLRRERDQAQRTVNSLSDEIDAQDAILREWESGHRLSVHTATGLHTMTFEHAVGDTFRMPRNNAALS